MEEKHLRKSKYLSMLLRHQPEKAGLNMRDDGFVDVVDLIKNTNISMAELKEIVATDKKKRYSFSPDQTMIRANQGHSIPWVVISYREIGEKELEQLNGKLYHGTKKKVLDSILKDGIKKMSRNFVHLSRDVATAKVVGDRRDGETIILEVDALKLLESGTKIYVSENGVYLVDHIPPEFIRVEIKKGD